MPVSFDQDSRPPTDAELAEILKPLEGIDAEYENWMQQGEQYQRDVLLWKQQALDNIDSAVQDWDSFASKNKLDLSFDPNPQRAKQKSIVDAWLTQALDGQPLPADDIARSALRSRIAESHFGGRGGASDEALFLEIEKQSFQRLHAKDLYQQLASSVTLATASPAAGENPKQFDEWIATVSQHPGFNPAHKAEYAKAWHMIQRDAEHAMQPFLKELNQIWIKGITNESVALDAWTLYNKLENDRDRQKFLATFALLANAYPQDQKATFSGNLSKQSSRDFQGLGDNVAHYLTRWWGEKLEESPYVDEQEAKRIRANNLARINFSNDLKDMIHGKVDPLKTLLDDQSALGAIERGLYSAPGAFATTGIALVPGFGLPATSAIIEQDFYVSSRRNLLASGLSDAEASAKAEHIARIAQLPAVLAERVGADILVGSKSALPSAINQKLVGLADRISRSTIGRTAASATGRALIETGTENFQDLMPHLVQDIQSTLDEDLPGTQWTGKGGVFDGYWTQTLTTFGAVAPMALMGIPANIKSDADLRKRIEAINNADTKLLQAYGYSNSEINRFKQDASKGLTSARDALNRLDNSRDPHSDEARLAVDSLAKELEKVELAQEEAAKAGVLPTFRRDGEGWTLTDQQGDTIGTAASASEAWRLAREYSAVAEDAEADHIAYLGSMLQAIDSQSGRDNLERSTSTVFKAGESLTTEQAANESRADAERIAAQTGQDVEQLYRQTQAREGLDGDPAVSGFILGRSVTDFKRAARETTNTLYQGASVLTVVHESAHGYLREAMFNGRIQRQELIEFLRAVDSVFSSNGQSRQAKPGKIANQSTEGGFFGLLKDQKTGRILEDHEITDTILDEAFAELTEAEILRTHKSGKDTTGYKLPAGLVSRNLSALARIAPTASKKFASFFRAIRALFGVAFSRAHALKKAFRDGTLDQTKYEQTLSKIFGLEQQDEHTHDAAQHAAEILTGQQAAFSIDSNPFLDLTSNQTHESHRHIIQERRAQQGARQSQEDQARSSAKETGGLSHGAHLGEGTESSVYQYGENHVLKIPHTSGALSYSSDGKITRSSDPQAWELKARAINLLGGMPTSVLSVEGKPVLLQDKGTTPVTEQELQDLRLPFNISPQDGHLYRLEFDGKSYLISDLAAHNFVKDADGNIRLTDLVIGEIDPNADLYGDISDSSFSIAPARMVDSLLDQLSKMPQNPKVKREMFKRIYEKFATLRRDTDIIRAAFGQAVTVEAIPAPRLTASIKREAAVLQALRTEELIDEVHNQTYGILYQEELTKLKQQPLHEFLSDPGSPLRGVLMSKSELLRQDKDNETTLALYDGTDGISRTLFGGSLTPDKAAQQLAEAGLIKDADVNLMWEKLRSEQDSVKRFRDQSQLAKDKINDARKQAREEARTWEQEQLAKQKKNYNPRSELLRSLAMLDGILMALPHELRGKIGGHTTLARLTNDDARLNYLSDKIEQIDRELERYLRKEFDQQWRALLDQARPAQEEEGVKKVGKAGYTIHALFDSLREAMHLDSEKASAMAEALEKGILSGNLEPDQEAHDELLAQLLPLVADWHHADAARRAAAVEMASSIYAVGYHNQKLIKIKQREWRNNQRQSLRAATGTKDTAAARIQKSLAENNLKGGWKKDFLGLLSFEQVMHTAFGEDSKAANALIARELLASNGKEDATQSIMDDLEAHFTTLAGSTFKGEKLRYQMAQPSITAKINYTGETIKLSPLQAIHLTMMWRQPDGRRHMLGHLNEDTGKPDGEWHYNQDFIDQLESQLDSDALATRAYISQQYSAEHAQINPVYRRIHGVDLPYNPHYSPLTVAPVQQTGAEGIDPVTGQSSSGLSTTPGSLRTRSQTAVAEPRIEDALQIFIAHNKQIQHWIHYAELSNDMRALVKNRTVSNATTAKGDKTLTSTLASWADLFALGGTRDAANHLSLNKRLNRMLSRAASAALIGRASVLMIQSTQLGAAMVNMPMASYVKRLGMLFSGQLGWGNTIRSPYIQRRIQQQPPIVRQALEGLEGTKPSKLKHLIQRMGNLIGGADALFTAGTYAITYDYQYQQALKRGMASPQAHQLATIEAERLTNQVAQPTRAGSRSLYENLATNPASRLMWAFASEPRQKLALLVYNLKHKPTPEKLRTIALLFAVNGLAANILRTAWRDLRDDEDDEIFDDKHWNLARIILSSATAPLDGLPIIGDITEASIFKLTGEYMPSGNLFDSLPRAANALTHIDDTLEGEREADQIIRDIDSILTGAAVTNDSLSAAASLSHLVKDIFDISQNIFGD